MAKEKDLFDGQQADAAAQQSASATPNYEKWRANLRSKYGEDKTDEELYDLSMQGYDTDHEAVKRYADEANEFAARVEENPEIGAIFAGILDRSLTDENYKENDTLATYADRKQAKDEAAAEEAKKKQLDELRAQAFEDVCKEDGVADPEGALQALQQVFENPCETLEQCKEQVRSFLKMVDYDAAVEAAEVRGRNANITAQRKKSAAATDGMTNSVSAAAAATSKPQSSIIETANRRAAQRNL